MMKVVNIGRRVLSMAAVVLMVSCHPDPTEVTFENTVIVYLSADNNLSGYARDNINKMEQAYDPTLGGKLLVFYNRTSGVSEILEISHDESSTIESKVLYTYPTGTNPNDGATLSDVINRCRELSKTPSYSLVLWSHGSGWLPYGMHPAKSPAYDDESQRAFGGGNSSGFKDMEIYEMAAALPTDLTFEYIYFDACHMASIELCYEMRHRTKYIIGSVAETLAEGYPYHTGLRSLITADAQGIAQNFFNFYDTRTSFMRSAAISVIDASKLDELALQISKMPTTNTLTAMQQFGRRLGYSSDYRNLMWDMEDMAERTWGATVAAPLLNAIDDAVVYKATTPILFEGDSYGEIVMTKHSGLSIYIPKLSQPETLAIYKDNYAWATDSKFYERAE